MVPCLNRARFIPVITELFALIDRREVFAVTSELTLAEVLVKPLRDKNVALAQTYQQLLQASHAFDIIPITRPIILDAAQRRASDATLKLPDAIHVATAVAHRCRSIITNDARIKALVGLDVLVLSAFI